MEGKWEVRERDGEMKKGLEGRGRKMRGARQGAGGGEEWGGREKSQDGGGRREGR